MDRKILASIAAVFFVTIIFATGVLAQSHTSTSGTGTGTGSGLAHFLGECKAEFDADYLKKSIPKIMIAIPHWNSKTLDCVAAEGEIAALTRTTSKECNESGLDCYLFAQNNELEPGFNELDNIDVPTEAMVRGLAAGIAFEIGTPPCKEQYSQHLEVEGHIAYAFSIDTSAPMGVVSDRYVKCSSGYNMESLDAARDAAIRKCETKMRKGDAGCYLFSRNGLAERWVAEINFRRIEIAENVAATQNRAEKSDRATSSKQEIAARKARIKRNQDMMMGISGGLQSYQDSQDAIERAKLDARQAEYDAKYGNSSKSTSSGSGSQKCPEGTCLAGPCWMGEGECYCKPKENPRASCASK